MSEIRSPLDHAVPRLGQPMVLPAPLAMLADHIRACGGTALAVGGCVRDHVMDRQPQDYDIEVYGLSLDQLRRELQHLGSVHEVGRSFGVIKVHISTPSEDMTIDVALPRRENKQGRGHRGFVVDSDPNLSYEEASARRDFTINAMAIQLDSNKFLDPHGGIDDLRARTLRHVSDAFSEDPLRVLRACQFASRFGLTIAPETTRLCWRLQEELSAVSRERIWVEMKKLLLLSPWPSVGFWALSHTGALSLFPELETLKGCPQEPNWHPEGDVWVHTLMVIDEAARLSRQDALDEEERLICILAAACHDLGKPLTTFTDDGVIRSPGHEKAGMKPARSLLEKMGAPDSISNSVMPLVLDHLKPYQLFLDQKIVTDAALRRLACRVSIPRLVRVAQADFLGRTTSEALSRQDEAGQWLQQETERLSLEDGAPKPILRGRHLLERGVPQGPSVGVFLDKAFQAQLEGEFHNLQEALAWLDAQPDIPLQGKSS